MVSKNTEKRIERYADKLGKSKETLFAELEKYIEKVQEMYPDHSKSKAESRAIKMLTDSYRRKYGNFARSSGDMYEGWIDGASQLRNQTEIKIRKIQSTIKSEGRQFAIFNGLIDENGTPIDDRATIFGRKNENFNKPLANSPPAYIRTLYGVARKKGEEEWKPFSLTSFGDIAEKITWKTNYPCEFIARAREGMELTAGNTTQFHPLKDMDWDMEEIYEDFIIPCSELEVRMNSEDWSDKDIRIKGTVVTLNPEPINDNGDRVMSVADLSLDLDESISCFIPGFVNANFTQDSEIILSGRVRPYRGKPAVTVYGVFPVLVPDVEFVGIDTEEDIQVGWIEPEDEF